MYRNVLLHSYVPLPSPCKVPFLAVVPVESQQMEPQNKLSLSSTAELLDSSHTRTGLDCALSPKHCDRQVVLPAKCLRGLWRQSREQAKSISCRSPKVTLTSSKKACPLARTDGLCILSPSYSQTNMPFGELHCVHCFHHV
ncbi:unnamed protein product [Cercospora beticola]|nr:unnamed protein product [Cercospora beticola]